MEANRSQILNRMLSDFKLFASMNASFHRIEELTKELKALQPFTEENQKRLDKKFRLEFNFNSNHMEGNTLTYSETELLLIFDDTKGNHTLREYEEMKAHDVALNLIQDWAKSSAERPLIEQNIKNLNEIILVRPFWKEAITPGGQNTRREIKIGDYKQFPNSVQLANGEMFEYASVGDTPILMGELMEWYRTEVKKAELPPVALAALFHYKFVRIHPFDDGNGRLARLLMNYVLFCFNLPPVIIKSSEKPNYLRALNRADTGDLEAFVQYISGELEWSLQLAIKAGKGESIEEEDDLDKQIALLHKKKESFLSKNIERTPELVESILRQEIPEFVKFLESQLSQTLSLFQHFEIDLYFFRNGAGNPTHLPSFASLIDVVSSDETFENVEQLSSVRFFLNFIELLTGKQRYNIRTEINFDFSKYELKVYVINTNIRLDALYSELSGKMNSFAKQVSDHIKREVLKLESPID